MATLPASSAQTSVVSMDASPGRFRTTLDIDVNVNVYFRAGMEGDVDRPIGAAQDPMGPVSGWAWKKSHMIWVALIEVVVAPTRGVGETADGLPGQVWPPSLTV